MAPNTQTAEEHDVEPGDFVRDHVQDETVIVLATPNQRANECSVAELGGMTVAECRSNAEFPDGDPVVEVAYVGTLNSKLGQWTPGKLLGMHTAGILSEQVTIYSMPVSRVQGETTADTASTAEA